MVMLAVLVLSWFGCDWSSIRPRMPLEKPSEFKATMFAPETISISFLAWL